MGISKESLREIPVFSDQQRAAMRQTLFAILTKPTQPHKVILLLLWANIIITVAIAVLLYTNYMGAIY